MSDDLGLNFRPKSYFRPEKLEKYLLSKVKGTVLRTKLKAMFGEGRHHEVCDLVGDTAFSVADRLGQMQRLRPVEWLEFGRY